MTAEAAEQKACFPQAFFELSLEMMWHQNQLGTRNNCGIRAGPGHGLFPDFQQLFGESELMLCILIAFILYFQGTRWVWWTRI